MPARRHRLRAASALPVLLFGLAACGTAEPVDATDDTAPSAATPSTTAGTSGKSSAGGSGSLPSTIAPELEFTAQTVGGASFDGTTLAGRDAVLWFWAPWCTECRREAPYVAAAQTERSDVTFVGVAGLGETAAMQDFVDDYDLDAFEHLADLDGSLWQRFGIVQQPAYAFIDADGTIDVVRGELGEAGLAERIDALTGN